MYEEGIMHGDISIGYITLGVPGACKGKRGILVDLDIALRTDERHLGFQVSPIDSFPSLFYTEKVLVTITRGPCHLCL